MVYAIFFLIVICVYPIGLAILFCYFKKNLDKKEFKTRVGGPYDGLKRFHKNRAIFYVMFFLLRRFLFILLLVIFEHQLFWTITTVLLTTEVSLVFILAFKPFESPYRN